MNAAEYEQTVAQIAASVARGAGGLPENATSYGKKNRWLGVSGIRHQIDVSIDVDERLHLVECKYWKQRVSLAHVLAFDRRLLDIRAISIKPVEGVIVSSRGFQRSAKQAATYFKIHWDVVESADVFGYKYGPRMVVSPKPATCVLSANSDVIVRIDGPDLS